MGQTLEQTSSFSLMFEMFGLVLRQPVGNSSEKEVVRRALSEKLFAPQPLFSQVPHGLGFVDFYYFHLLPSYLQTNVVQFS